MTIIDPYFIDMIIAMRKILTKIDSPGLDTFPFFAYKERRLDDLSSKESFTEDDFYHWIPYGSEFNEEQKEAEKLVYQHLWLIDTKTYLDTLTISEELLEQPDLLFHIMRDATHDRTL